ncbi:MAG: DUF3455 domain-containing protein [Alphaproteobacteria bacterium]|nr:DUF3455 domain-containing protein [Alphaproteobacteria bacterium]
MSRSSLFAASAALLISGAASAADLPAAIQVKGETVVFQAHGVGAQIYECRGDASGKLTWQFREPIATLIRDGKTVGRHYAGPSWQVGVSEVKGKLNATSPAPNPKDIPWLKLSIDDPTDDGELEGVTTVQRINTSGGVAAGTCDKPGDFHAEPYAADYLFLKK